MDVEQEEDHDVEGRMLRRETDPKTGKHTSCEPAQSKCTCSFDKGHFVWQI